MTQPDIDQGGLDPQTVIDYLGRQIGVLSTQLAMRDVLAEQLQRKVTDLEMELQATRERQGLQGQPPAPPDEPQAQADVSARESVGPLPAGLGPNIGASPPAPEDLPTTTIKAPAGKGGR